ncbi:hypothetical protein [Teredinibacter haidensis]|uniref:hypothetical protein n=1 Tax=Teredinibacter haidensis TaxID=2731755 RepID=UPI0009FB20A3|nr:hypothetical protein [Teredinibacter haidensis]
MEWSQIEIFKGIDLNDSFVLSWYYEADNVSFELDASIWPESEYYSTPKKNEYTCYRKATLEFVGVKKVSGLKLRELVQPTTDPDGSVDYGKIDELNVADDSFLVVGDFGKVNIQGGELRFEVHT